MSVTLREVMGAARSRAASLAAEVAGYLVLGAADQAAARAVTGDDVVLGEDGTVRIASGHSADDAQAEAALRLLLGQLLLEASSVTPALLRASQRPAAAGIDALVQELEAALIPVNRGAGRRALARLHRDTDRARAAGALEPTPRRRIQPWPPSRPFILCYWRMHRSPPIAAALPIWRPRAPWPPIRGGWICAAQP